jgi:hypothetical protein
VARAVGTSRSKPPAGIQPLSPRLKWRAITLATLVLVPAYWAVLAALVSVASKGDAGPNPGPALAFGLSMVPFVFLVLAFMSGHPRAPGAVIKAMGLALLVGIPVSALAADAVTGMVAGIGAGGTVALRADEDHNWRARAIAVTAATAYSFVLLHTVPDAGLLAAPIFPFTSIGVADHLSERRREREAARATDS